MRVWEATDRVLVARLSRRPVASSRKLLAAPARTSSSALARTLTLALTASLTSASSTVTAGVDVEKGVYNGMGQEYYRRDGVRITHDPYAPGMAAKYGRPGNTDPDGFDPYADSVGAGIYGGNVLYDKDGNVVVGQQYQNHNPRPGPIYAKTGYTDMSKALHEGPAVVSALLDNDPTLVSEISTGGAQPLHMCGMSRRNQESTSVLIKAGADIEALDTYGYTPLHRMASNNLPVGAEALLAAGANPNGKGAMGDTPMRVAQSSRASDVIRVLRKYGAK